MACAFDAVMQLFKFTSKTDSGIGQWRRVLCDSAEDTRYNSDSPFSAANPTDGSSNGAGLHGDGGQPQQRDKIGNEFSLISFV